MLGPNASCFLPTSSGPKSFYLKKCAALNIVNLRDLEVSSGFLNVTPETQAAEENNRYLGLRPNLKHLCFTGHD